MTVRNPAAGRAAPSSGALHACEALSSRGRLNAIRFPFRSATSKLTTLYRRGCRLFGDA